MKKTTFRVSSVASRTLLFSMLLCLASFILFGLLLAVFGERFVNYLIMIPFLSGYLHTNLTHFGLNMLLLFGLLHAASNESYTYKDLFRITFLISLLYLPVAIFGITDPAVGISGTVYFLMARYFLSMNNKQTGILWLSGILLLELFSHTPESRVAYGVHYLGVLVGALSLKRPIFWGFQLRPLCTNNPRNQIDIEKNSY
ncbi:MAG: hypothetical protein ACKO5C_05125 [Ferruginibacter sp.]